MPPLNIPKGIKFDDRASTEFTKFVNNSGRLK